LFQVIYGQSIAWMHVEKPLKCLNLLRKLLFILYGLNLTGYSQDEINAQLPLSFAVKVSNTLSTIRKDVFVFIPETQFPKSV